MRTLLIDHASCIATFDHSNPSQSREWRDASVWVRGHVIEWIGPAAELPPALRDSAARLPRSGWESALEAAEHIHPARLEDGPGTGGPGDIVVRLGPVEAVPGSTPAGSRP